MNFDYKDTLQMDDETYNAMLPQIESMEQRALQTIQRLQGNPFGMTSPNVKFYCQTRIWYEMFSDTMSASIHEYWRASLMEQEEMFRYGYFGDGGGNLK